MRGWFHNRVVFPFLPFGLDLLIRTLALQGVFVWWQYPDLKTLSVTAAFFCFLLIIDVKSTGSIASDDGYHEQIRSLRTRLTSYAVSGVFVFSVVSIVDIVEKLDSEIRLSERLFPYLLIFSIVVLISSVLDAALARKKFRVGY